MVNRFFITGTGTGIGKTFVTSALASQLRQKHKVTVAKPVISGWDDNSDTHVLLAANGQEANDENITACSPWRFKAPLSPDMAAGLEKRKIVFNEVVKFCRSVGEGADYVFIEGAGGVMTPLNNEKTFRDLAVELNVKTLLICGSYLGAISHALTALEALRDVANVAVVVNESADSIGNAETKDSLIKFTDRKVFSLARGIEIIEGLDNYF